MSKAQDPQSVSFEPVDFAAWRAAVEAELKGSPFDKALRTRTPEGITLEPLYSAEDWRAVDEYPGLGSFVRGGTLLGRSDGWKLAPLYDAADPETAGELLRSELDRGANAAWLVFDRAGRLGIDPASPEASAFVGPAGIAIDDAGALARVLRSLSFPDVHIIVDAGAAGVPAVALLAAAMAECGTSLAAADVTIACDPLGQLASEGALAGSFDDALAQLTILGQFASAELPAARIAVASSLPYHDAGGHAVDELAYGIATALCYVRALEDGGLAPAIAARAVGLRFAVGRNIFLEMAKLRAARVLWAKALAAGGVTNVPPSIHAVASARTLSKRDPWVNMLRTTTQTFAAICGGADIITTHAFDAALGHPSELGRRMARNTQIVLGEESRLGQVVDPAGGSWYVESITDKLARAAWSQLQSIENRGGVIACLKDGTARQSMNARWSELASSIRRRKVAVTGVTEFANLQEQLPSPPKARDEESVDRIVRRAGERARASAEVIDAVRGAAADECVRRAIQAAKGGASLCELTTALKRGEPEKVEPFESHREAEEFERLRDIADANRPRVFLANLGTIPEHKARAGFAANFFAAGGVESIGTNGTDDAPPGEAATQIAAAFVESGASVACICGTDLQYASMAAIVAVALRERGARTVYLAGKPGVLEKDLAAAGVSRYLFMGCDVFSELEWLLGELEVTR